MRKSVKVMHQPELWYLEYLLDLQWLLAEWLCNENMEVDQKTGKFKLSAKALKEKPEGYVELERPARGDRGPRPERRGPRPERRNPEADGARLNRH